MGRAWVFGVFLWVAGSALAQEPFFYFLDLDRMFLKDRSAMVAGDPEYHLLAGEPHRLAPFAPEALVALRYGWREPKQLPSRVALFSGGRKARNGALRETLRLSESLRGTELIDSVFSFDDLLSTKPLPPHQGGQDDFDFFSYFTKDLRIASKDLERTVILDDNINVTPTEQLRNILVVARPDVDEETLVRPDFGGAPAFKQPKGQRSPIQVARSKYRLVRAIGVLDWALEQVERGEFPSVPAALSFLQWDSKGRFRSGVVNHPTVYARGLRILQSVYERYLAPNGPVMPRASGYFKIDPLFPREKDCGAFVLRAGSTFLPWDHFTEESFSSSPNRLPSGSSQ